MHRVSARFLHSLLLGWARQVLAQHFGVRVATHTLRCPAVARTQLVRRRVSNVLVALQLALARLRVQSARAAHADLEKSATTFCLRSVLPTIVRPVIHLAAEIARGPIEWDPAIVLFLATDDQVPFFFRSRRLQRTHVPPGAATSRDVVLSEERRRFLRHRWCA